MATVELTADMMIVHVTGADRIFRPFEGELGVALGEDRSAARDEEEARH